MRNRGVDFSPRSQFEFCCLGLLYGLAHESDAILHWQVRYLCRRARQLGLLCR